VLFLKCQFIIIIMFNALVLHCQGLKIIIIIIMVVVLVDKLISFMALKYHFNLLIYCLTVAVCCVER